MLVQQAAPQVVGQDHVFGHHAVQRRVALARHQAYRRVRIVGVAVQIEAVFHAGIVFGLAAHVFALRRQRLRQLPQRTQPVAVRNIDRRVGQAGLGDLRVQHVVAQVFAHHYALQARIRLDDLARFRVGHHVQRQHGHFAARVQRERLDDVVGLHRDFVARHVDGGQARARQLVEFAVAGDRQAGGGHVYAHAQATVG
ncbi:hypothetical protein D3C77_556850 [compost metagenome]